MKERRIDLHPLAEAAVRMEMLYRQQWLPQFEWKLAPVGWFNREPILVHETPMILDARWPDCTYQRNAAIVDYDEQHFERREIARRFGISRARVYQILKEDREKRERLRRMLFDFRDDQTHQLAVQIHWPDLDKPYEPWETDWVRYEVVTNLGQPSSRA